MTNKINGIDVSGAELYEKIVQLQKEIEAYKQSENEAKEIIAELEHKNNCLHKKNDKLKKKKDEYFVMNLNYEIKISDLIQAFEEIRGIAEDAYNNDKEYQATGVYNEIVDKINEALNDRG